MEIRYDLQNFTNIDDEDFVGKWGQQEYVIKTGETKAFPGFLVKHFAKHLINKILIKKNVANYSDPSLREPLEKQILGEVVLTKPKTAKKSEGQVVKEQVEETQKEFEELEKRKQEEIRAKRLAALEKARAAKEAKKSEKQSE